MTDLESNDSSQRIIDHLNAHPDVQERLETDSGGADTLEQFQSSLDAVKEFLGARNVSDEDTLDALSKVIPTSRCLPRTLTVDPNDPTQFLPEQP